MPADFAKAEALYNSTQDEIPYLSPEQWRYEYENTTATGIADFYTVIDRQIYIAPIPSAAQTLTLSYVRRVSHLNSGGTVVAGVMSNDTDLPIFGSEFHYYLVLDGAIIGGQLLGDFDWQALVPQRDEILAAMRPALVGATQGEMSAQAGAWPG